MARRKQSKDALNPSVAEMPLETIKKLEDYEQSKPSQLELFQFLDMKPSEAGRYSNTIELYDFIPKYHWGKVERIGGEFLRVLEREFECRGSKYKIRVAPAKLTDKDGVTRDYYPSKREELVEDALRRFATTQRGLYLDDKASVSFTLYQLQKELKKSGHTYSINELKDALYICAQTSLIVHNEDGSAVLISSMFETVGLQTREDWQGKGAKTKAFVRFNTLVTESIKRGTYRQFDYEKSMSYKNVVARQLHKRMSHHYTQASITQPYNILLSTIIRDFGISEYERPSLNLNYVIKALEEMKGKDVILRYEVIKVNDSGNRNKLIDAKIIITPHPFFANAIKNSNARHKRIEESLFNAQSPKTTKG